MVLNIRSMLLFANLVGSLCLPSFSAAEANETQARGFLLRSTRIFDNPWEADADVRRAIQCVEYDTNRFVSVLQQIATEAPSLASCMVCYMGRFGNSSCLPFLYQNIVNTNCETQVVRAILKLEGVTSNAVEKVEEFAFCDAMRRSDRYMACVDLVAAAYAEGVPDQVRGQAFDVAMRFQSSTNCFAQFLDERMCCRQPAYSNSLRRLNVLRTALASGIHPAYTNYVIRAISTLEAYPEANLPE